MGRYKAICSYDGYDFLGFQIQNEGRTIQREIQKYLSTILDCETTITASGRTDAKVHALGQVFHFDSIKELDVEKFRYSLNRILPSDIHIISLEKVNDDFNARISAKGKHYRYILNQGEGNPFNNRYVNEFNRKLDVNKMSEASKLFVGEHNFMNFTSKEEDFQNFIRNIERINITTDGDQIIFDFYGNGFMRYMIRMLVGTLIEIGLNKIDATYIKNNLDVEKRLITSYKASGNGLYLVEVFY